MTGGHSFKGKDEILERKKELKRLEAEIETNRENFDKFKKKLSEVVLEAEKAEKEKEEKEKLFENFNCWRRRWNNRNSDFKK